ncbi:MAG: hypothetical protein U0354_01195 [Candidatus Sericytochromatia bacterium]
MVKKVISSFLVSLLFVGGASVSYQKAEAASYKLTSFNSIRNIEISELEKEADIINFDEFLRVYYYNYLANKTEQDKNKTINRIEKDINRLKYSDDISSERQPPIILHWTDADNAMGVIKTLFQERRSMKEGIIGVDYVVTEPLLHPDYPDRKARAYTVKFSRSDVATTWYHVPDKNMESMGHEDRKYNKAINIEIVGWRFLPNKKGKNNGMGKSGKWGIRENFDNDFQDFDNKFTTYPTVLKLLNYLAEKHQFGNVVDQFTVNSEIDQNIKNTKGWTYLNGPLSEHIKGHGLIAMEHTLKYGGDYINMRHDFTPSELLIVYEDLKNFRIFRGNRTDSDMIASVDKDSIDLEYSINNTNAINQYEAEDLRTRIMQVKDIKKKEYLLYALHLKSENLDSIEKVNDIRKNLDYLDSNDREKLMSTVLVRFFSESQDIKADDYDYLKVVIDTVRDKSIRENLAKTLKNKYGAKFKSRFRS